MPLQVLEKIKQTIQSNIENAEVYVSDPMSDATHFQAIVISPDFEDMSLVQQQRIIMNSLKDAFDTNVVHALELKTFTPEKWAAQKDQYLPVLS